MPELLGWNNDHDALVRTAHGFPVDDLSADDVGELLPREGLHGIRGVDDGDQDVFQNNMLLVGPLLGHPGFAEGDIQRGGDHGCRGLALNELLEPLDRSHASDLKLCSCLLLERCLPGFEDAFLEGCGTGDYALIGRSPGIPHQGQQHDNGNTTQFFQHSTRIQHYAAILLNHEL